MKAVIAPAYRKDRKPLNQCLPINTPWRLTISPAQICNFKCYFCTHSLNHKEVEKTGFSFRNMTFEEFKILADQLRQFPEAVKLIVFSGMGEPLLNPDLSKMIRYLKENHIAERAEMYSNATLLTEKLVHDLVDAGLDSFKVSIEGLTEEKYWTNSQYRMNYPEFMEKLAYFYNNRKTCKIYIKVIDACLEAGEDQKFYQMFGDVCDEIYIEHLSDAQPLTGDCEGRVDYGKTMYGEPAKECNVCGMLFYSLYVDVDLNIYPCPLLCPPVKFAIGNANAETLLEIWHGEKLKRIRQAHLMGKRKEVDVCKDCGNIICMYHPEDDLDDHAEDLLCLYQ